MADMPEIGVKLVAQQIDRFLSDLERVQNQADAVRASFKKPIAISFMVTPPSEAEFNAVISRVQQATTAANKQAVIKFTVDAADAQVAAQAAAKGAASATQAQAKEDRRQQEARERTQRRNDQADSLRAQRTAERERRNADVRARQAVRAQEDAAMAGMSARERIEARRLRDINALQEQMNRTRDQPARASLSEAMRSREQAYRTEIENFNRTQSDALNDALSGFDRQVQRMGVSRGETFYVFRDLEAQRKQFHDNLDQTLADYGQAVTGEQMERIRAVRTEYDRLFQVGVGQAETAAGDRLHRKYFEGSFMGELARQETRTYGVRIMAGEMQRYGAMMMGAGLAGVYGSNRAADRYLTEFRQPLGRVTRALGLTEQMEDMLDETLLDRAGTKSFLTANQQAESMRIWAEAVNVVVDSYDDLLSTVDGMEVGLVAQTELINNLVKLNEGSASLDQSVTDIAAIMTQFDLFSSDAAEQTENLLKVVALLDTAASSGLADVNDIGAALNYFAGAASNLGVSLTEAVVMVEALAQAGQKGQKAGRGLEQLIKSIVKPTPRGEQGYESLFGPQWRNYLFDPSSGDFRGMITFIEELAKATKDLSQLKRGQVLTDITGDANARRMLTYLLQAEYTAMEAGTGYMRNMVELRNNGNEQIKDSLALLQEQMNLELGSVSAVDSYTERMKHLSEQRETRYTNALARMDAAGLKLGKNLAVVVVPAVEALAGAVAWLADVVDKHPFLAGLFFYGGAATALGGGMLAAGGTLARAGTDIFALLSAFGSARGQGLPWMTSLMGLNTSQTSALVAALKVGTTAAGELTDAEVSKIIRLAMSKGGSGAIIAAAGAGPEALSSALMATSVATRSFAVTLGSAALAVGAFALTAWAASKLIPAGDKLLRRQAEQNEALKTLAPQVADEASLSQGTWILGALATKRGKNLAQYVFDVAFVDRLARLFGATPSNARNLPDEKKQEVRERIVGSAEQLRQWAEEGTMPLRAKLPMSIMRFFSGGAIDYETVEGTRRFANFARAAAKMPAIDYEATERRERARVDLRETALQVSEIPGETGAGILDLVQVDPDALEKYVNQLMKTAQSYGQQMRIAGASSEDVLEYYNKAQEAVSAFALALDDPSKTIFDMAADAAKLEEELAKAADVVARLHIEGGFADVTDWMGPGAPVTQAVIDQMGSAALAGIGEQAQELADLGIELPASALNEARDLVIQASQGLSGAMERGLTPTVSNVQGAMDAATSKFYATVEYYRRQATLLGDDGELDFTKVFERAVGLIDDLRSGLSDAGVEQEQINGLVENYRSYLESSNLAAHEFPNYTTAAAIGVNDMADRMERFVALLALAQGDASLLALILANMPTLPGASVGKVEDRVKINAILETGRQGTLSREQAMREEHEAEQARLKELGATQEDLAQSTRYYQSRLEQLSSSTGRAARSAQSAAQTFEDIVGKVRSMIAQRISPSSGMAVTDEEMGLAALGKYQEGAWEPLRRLASAATDPQSEWGHLLPAGMGVASKEAQAYLAAVKGGVERFDPAYSAFFPDRGKIVEGVIGDLEGEKRREDFITSVIAQMGQMGYDEASLRKYFADPQEELERSVSLLRLGVDDQVRASDDSTRAVRDQIDAAGINTESLGTLTTSVDTLTYWMSSGAAGGRAPEDIPTEEADGKKSVIIYDPNVVVPPGGVKPFARGGLVTHPTFALLGEAGPEMVVPLSRAGMGKGFVAPYPAINMRYSAPHIGSIQMNTNVTAPSPAYVAHSVGRSQQRMAVGIGRQILQAAAREGV